MSTTRYLPAVRSIAQSIPDILVEHGLDPRISRYVLTETEEGEAWLFVVLDDSIWERLESYSASSLLCLLSTALHGHPVVFTNSFGLCYAVLLSPAKSLVRA